MMTYALSYSQKSDRSSDSLQIHNLLFTEANPIHSFGIFTLNAPFFIGTFDEDNSEFAVSYAMANVWHPPATVYYPKNLTPQQRAEVNELYYTDRPDFFETANIATDTKHIATDGVLQNINISYLKNFKKHGSLLVNLQSHALSGGHSPLHFLASDHFIEQVHDLIGQEDNFGRRRFPFNKANISFTDENNRSIAINQGRFFLGTLNTHYYYPVFNKQSRTSWLLLQTGGHLTIPLNGYYPNVSGGISASFLYRQQVLPRFSTDISINGMTVHNRLFGFGDAPNIIDKTLRNTAKLYIGFNFTSRKDNTFYLGILNNYQDALLDGYIFSRSQDEYQDLGVSFAQNGDTWQHETLTGAFPINKLTPASMYFFSIKTYLILGRQTKRGNFSFMIGEDILSVNNAPDIQYSFGYSYRL